MQFACLLLYSTLVFVLLFDIGMNPPKGVKVPPVYPEKEDPKVLEERRRTEAIISEETGPALKAANLTKKYYGADPDVKNRPDGAEANPDEQGKLAVKGVSFSVKRGEVFALLGVNGAGKSSTFNMIVGEEALSGGKSTLQGIPIEEVYRRPHLLDGLVGYCP